MTGVRAGGHPKSIQHGVEVLQVLPRQTENKVQVDVIETRFSSQPVTMTSTLLGAVRFGPASSA